MVGWLNCKECARFEDVLDFAHFLPHPFAARQSGPADTDNSDKVPGYDCIGLEVAPCVDSSLIAPLVSDLAHCAVGSEVLVLVTVA